MTQDAPTGPATLFLDCDGVLLDVSERYYRVHCEILGREDGGGLSKAAFWEMKRGRRPLPDILAAGATDSTDEAAYRHRWLSLIESRDFLGLDVVIEGAVEALELLRLRRPLVLVTLRMRPDYLFNQLNALGLRAFFEDVLTAEPRGGASWRVKADLIGARGQGRPDSTILGDTEVDIRAGKALGMRTVAVTSGIRGRASLESEHPDRIFESLHDYQRSLHRPTAIREARI